MKIRPLELADAPACDAIMRSLPDWFGHEGGLADCARAVRTQSGWVAEDSGEVIGFAIWEPRTDVTAEVTWMAVHRDHRNRGVGTAIIEHLVGVFAERGFKLALAMTSGAHKIDFEGPDPYDDTRAFWRARGFLPLTELDLWETDFALLMVRPLASRRT